MTPIFDGVESFAGSIRYIGCYILARGINIVLYLTIIFVNSYLPLIIMIMSTEEVFQRSNENSARDAEINKILLDRAVYDAESSRYAGYTDVLKVTHLLIAIVKECVLSISFHFLCRKKKPTLRAGGLRTLRRRLCHPSFLIYLGWRPRVCLQLSQYSLCTHLRLLLKM